MGARRSPRPQETPLPTSPPPPTTDAPVPSAADPGRFRRTLVRVMAVQVVTLLLLWLLQARYGS